MTFPAGGRRRRIGMIVPLPSNLAPLSSVSRSRNDPWAPEDNQVQRDRFVESLYLPDTGPGRLEVARRVARSWVVEEIGIPLRRVHMVGQRGASC